MPFSETADFDAPVYNHLMPTETTGDLDRLSDTSELPRNTSQEWSDVRPVPVAFTDSTVIAADYAPSGGVVPETATSTAHTLPAEALAEIPEAREAIATRATAEVSRSEHDTTGALDPGLVGGTVRVVRHSFPQTGEAAQAERQSKDSSSLALTQAIGGSAVAHQATVGIQAEAHDSGQ
jgi:hypothetical protein